MLYTHVGELCNAFCVIHSTFWFFYYSCCTLDSCAGSVSGWGGSGRGQVWRLCWGVGEGQYKSLSVCKNLSKHGLKLWLNSEWQPRTTECKERWNVAFQDLPHFNFVACRGLNLQYFYVSSKKEEVWDHNWQYKLNPGLRRSLHSTMWTEHVDVVCVTARYWPDFLPSSLLAMVKAGKCLSVAFLASAVLYELGPSPFTEPSETTQYYCTTTSLCISIH